MPNSTKSGCCCGPSGQVDTAINEPSSQALTPAVSGEVQEPKAQAVPATHIPPGQMRRVNERQAGDPAAAANRSSLMSADQGSAVIPDH